METNETNRASNELKWKLAGIADERRKLQDYIGYLDTEEKRLREQAMTGTAATPARGKATGTSKAKTTAPAASGKKRKRVITHEQREKMRAAAKKRWAGIRASETTQAAPTAEAVPVSPLDGIQ